MLFRSSVLPGPCVSTSAQVAFARMALSYCASHCAWACCACGCSRGCATGGNGQPQRHGFGVSRRTAIRGDNLPAQVRAFQPIFKAESVAVLLDLNKELAAEVRAKGRRALAVAYHAASWADADRLARAGGSDLTDEAARLWAFASTQGIDSESDLAWDGVFTNGRRAKPTHRLWGQTELLKAQLSRLEQGADRSSAGVAATVDAIFRHHLDPAPEACWRDQLNEDLRWTDDKIPASSLYHLTLAFSELLRVAELLEASRE